MEKDIQTTQHYQKARSTMSAENKCMKERRSQVPFSPEVRNTIGYIVMWKVIYKRATSKVISHCTCNSLFWRDITFV